ncbi:hypothetical protein pipiens_014936 [Culex pipiens pipiens]|uniref:Uncharacterized protein n=1 Tax=Culex pipiens pipiens TaxID=38569 RepID=A0ABD1CSH7_CULPP
MKTAAIRTRPVRRGMAATVVTQRTLVGEGGVVVAEVQDHVAGEGAALTDRKISLSDTVDELVKETLEIIGSIVDNMDGPHVNLKLFRDLDEEMKTVEGNGRSLLNIGSCGLHGVHNAFRNGIKQAGWEMDSFFISLKKLFKDYPLRRAEYKSTTGSNIFPLKFCATRWVENGKVAERAQQMLPHLRKYVSAVEQQSRTKMKDSNPAFKRSFATVEKSKSFISVAKAINDPLFEAQLSFFSASAGHAETFLREFQSESPMVPFLYEELTALVRGVMEKVLNPDIISRAKVLSEVELSDKNLLPTEKVDVGIATKINLKQCAKKHNVPELRVFEFRKQCREYYKGFLKKILERSPLNYSLTRSLSCLNPSTIAKTPKIAAQRLEVCLEKMVETSNLTGPEADRVKAEYTQLLGEPHIVEMFSDYKRSTERLDTHWNKVLLACDKKNDHLRDFVQTVLILSHGNAGLERGLSINEECLIENLKEHSLVAQRMVYDSVQVSGGVLKVEITKSLVQHARNANARYKEALEIQRQQESAELQEQTRKREANDQIKALEAKKKQTLSDAQKEAADIEAQIRELMG